MPPKKDTKGGGSKDKAAKAGGNDDKGTKFSITGLFCIINLSRFR